MRSSVRGGGVFSGLGVSSSFRVDLDFPAFFVLPETSLDFFFADFGLGVGVWRRFDFGLRSGVSRGVGSGVASSSSQILALPYERGGIPVRPAIRYRRWSTLLLPPLLWGLASAIFFPSEKGLFYFATCRLPILRGESRLVLFPRSQTRLHRYAKHCGQEPCVFFPICPSMLLLPGSETFLVSETAKNAPRSVRTHPA